MERKINLTKMIKQAATESWFDGKFPWQMFCPQCGFEFIHLIRLTCLRGTDLTTITAKGIFVEEAENKTRGVRITLEYQCENGHRGEIILQFHKGNVFINHKTIPTEYDEEGHYVLEADIWRD